MRILSNLKYQEQMFRTEKEYLQFLKPGKKGSVEWSSPSNIALVKYWGKRKNQEPENPSLSFSLSESKTVTGITYEIKKEKGFSWNFFFEGFSSALFEPKLNLFFNSIITHLPFLNYLNINISSFNTFPHSSGIASSASAMSALSLCLLEIDSQITGEIEDPDTFFTKASFIARLGSGSAARSVFPAFSLWGTSENIPGSTDQYAIPMNLPADSYFSQLCDAILITSSEKKRVSSSLGHELMKNNPYSSVRYQTARDNLAVMVDALRYSSKETFIRITELEALTLHGLMMTSDPGFILINQDSIEIIRSIRKLREETGLFVSFTLDAGPNVHLIYHENDFEIIRRFIERDLLLFTEENHVIWDRIGKGPQKTSLLS